jgi:hypothetical protein
MRSRWLGETAGAPRESKPEAKQQPRSAEWHSIRIA